MLRFFFLSLTGGLGEGRSFVPLKLLSYCDEFDLCHKKLEDGEQTKFNTIHRYLVIIEKVNLNKDRLDGLVVTMSDHEVTGSIPGTSTNFKPGLGLERGPPSLMRTTG